MEQSPTIQALTEALVAAQAEMPKVAFDSTNPFLKNRYASLGAVIEASRPILAKYGLAVTQWPISDMGKIGITSRLVHKSGEWMSDRIVIAAGEEKGKSHAQIAGSIVTYLRRYSLASILGLYADEDVDAQHPAPSGHPVAKSAPEAKPTPRKPAPEAFKALLDQFKAQCLRAAGGDEEIAVNVLRDRAHLLPNEVMEHLTVESMPKGESARKDTLAAIEELAGTVAAPGDSAPPEGETATGYIKLVTEKGTSKGGTRYGILLVQDLEDKTGGDWFNTFDDKDGEMAKSLKGEFVTLIYEQTKFGNDLVKQGVIPGEVTP